MAASTTCPLPDCRASSRAASTPTSRYSVPPPKSPTRLSGGTGAPPAGPMALSAPVSAM